MKSRSRAAVRSFIVRQQVPKGDSGGLICLLAWGSSPRSRCPGSPGRGRRSGSRRSGCPALPALCRCLPFSSFKAAPAALAPGSLICRATPRLPPLPQPRRGGGDRHPGGEHPPSPPRTSRRERRRWGGCFCPCPAGTFPIRGGLLGRAMCVFG